VSKVFVIAQGGGPTAVINQTLVGAVLEARRRAPGARVLGSRFGVRGIPAGDFVDLAAVSEADLRAIAGTPGAALGSTRDKPDAAYCERILAGLAAAGADAFIYIGGNDTAGTLDVLDKAGGGRMAFVHAPKTIDNDLVENDHTPGFISAGLFVAGAFLSADLDLRAMPGIYVGIVMGRHAGFLTAASAAWRRDDADAPHLVYVPEAPFAVERLIADIGAVRERYGRCVVAMSEGVTADDGTPLAARLVPPARQERDAHGNLQLSGGDLGVALQSRIAAEFPKGRGRVDTFGYTQRAFVGTIDPRDQKEAFAVGAYAVAASERGSGSVVLTYADGRTDCAVVPLAAVAGKTRTLPAEYFSSGRLTAAGAAYFGRLLPPRPVAPTPFV
jgi:6-phosphofructokinase